MIFCPVEFLVELCFFSGCYIQALLIAVKIAKSLADSFFDLKKSA